MGSGYGGMWSIGWDGSMVRMLVRQWRINCGDHEQGSLDREEWTEEIDRRRLEVMAGAE